MKRFLPLLFIFGCYVSTEAIGKCARPFLQRSKVFIYSSFGKVPVKVSRCLFNNTQHAYSDISDNCVGAFHSGVFTDKWADNNVLKDEGSPIVLEEYVSRADLVKNEVSLRSGITCRYDRGFCYDPIESNTYAVVWEILQKGVYTCPAQLYKVFDGDVDIWEFKPQNLTYLFFYDSLNDDAFYLSLDAKEKCQKNDVWYSKDGYIVSFKPLVAKDMVSKSPLKKPSKNGKTPPKEAASSTYFTYRTKKVVSENILKNCDVRSLSFEDIGVFVTSDYLENPHTLHVLAERYFNLIVATKAELLALIESQSTVAIVKELKEQLILLSQLLDTSKSEIVVIQQILKEAGNLKSIRVDVDNFAKQMVRILKKSEEYAQIVKNIQLTINENTENINVNNKQLKSVTEKVGIIQNVLDNKIPESITKSEVTEKISQVEQIFHKKLTDLTMNVTLLILSQHSDDNSVKGNGRDRADIETVIIEKLRTFNTEKFQSSINGLKENVYIHLLQLKTQSYNNLTAFETRLLKKLDNLATKNAPILRRVEAYEQQLEDLLLQIKNMKVDASNAKEKNELFEKEAETKITSIFEKFGDFDKIINQVKVDLNTLTHKETDLNPLFEKVKTLIAQILTPEAKRLDDLESIAVQLTDDIHKGAEEIEDLETQVKDIVAAVKRLETWKGDANGNFVKEVKVAKNKIENSHAAIDDHSKKQKDVNIDSQTKTQTETTILIQNQETEIQALKAELSLSINKISAMEKNLEAVLKKTLDGEKLLLNNMQLLDNKIGSTHSQLVTLDSNVRLSFSQCCSAANANRKSKHPF